MSNDCAPALPPAGSAILRTNFMAAQRARLDSSPIIANVAGLARLFAPEKPQKPTPMSAGKDARWLDEDEGHYKVEEKSAMPSTSGTNSEIEEEDEAKEEEQRAKEGENKESIEEETAGCSAEASETKAAKRPHEEDLKADQKMRKRAKQIRLKECDQPKDEEERWKRLCMLFQGRRTIHPKRINKFLTESAATEEEK
ncbi:unnamed protein product [Bursaphelenchus okinawaensis]|uniref:Uncharacterized protein n=1 Tax=Bursaphelenchus okinawaensis TaxID=465554 RepID=A0A811JUY7_9BILA|nr:unnamed protein product [Bursaphelenchus okinawaensis]CAG9084238.1 unnamed protein product [Bursaphelenchus okinawaensis]